MKKSLLLGFLLLLSLLLAACSSGSSALNEDGKQGVKEKVHAYSVGTFENVSAVITSHELIVTDLGKKTRHPLPEDEFFVSIAPFVESTHECAIHSLTGCQGELVEKDFAIQILDDEDNIVMDETISSLKNGFIDLWLPRDQTYRVQIEYDDKKVQSQISTFKGDKTCITTMQLT